MLLKDWMDHPTLYLAYPGLPFIPVKRHDAVALSDGKFVAYRVEEYQEWIEWAGLADERELRSALLMVLQQIADEIERLLVMKLSPADERMIQSSIQDGKSNGIGRANTIASIAFFLEDSGFTKVEAMHIARERVAGSWSVGTSGSDR